METEIAGPIKIQRHMLRCLTGLAVKLIARRVLETALFQSPHSKVVRRWGSERAGLRWVGVWVPMESGDKLPHSRGFHGWVSGR